MGADRNYLAAIGTTIGTIVGAGILALPYAISKAGFFYGIALFLIIGVASILITLYTAELSYAEKRMHQLPVMVEKYLGSKLKVPVLILQMLTIYGAMIAYLVGLGVALALIFSVPYDLTVFIVFILTVPLIYKGYNVLEQSETPLSFIKIALILIVSLIAFMSFNYSNISYLSVRNFFEPIGVVLFAMTSFTVIPEVKAEVKNDPKKLVKAILISYAISIFIYILFSLAFVGAFGTSVASVATNSIKSGVFSLVMLLTTVFLLITPYLALGLVLVDSFFYDFKVGRFRSLLIGVVMPFVVALVHPSFQGLLSVTGGIFVSLLALFILAAVLVGRRKEKKARTYRVWGGLPLIVFTAVVMMVGALYTFVYL